MMGRNDVTRLHVYALGAAFGIAEGVVMLLFAWAAWLSGYGMILVNDIGTLYYGYAPTFMGGIFGGLWGFVVGFIFGIIVAWAYNYSLNYLSKS